MKYHRCNEIMNKNLWWGHLKSTFVQNSQFLTPSFLSPVCFTCTLFSMYVCFSELPHLLSKNFFAASLQNQPCKRLWIFKWVKREKWIIWFKNNVFHSYIHMDNKNIYKFIENVKWKKNVWLHLFNKKPSL